MDFISQIFKTTEKNKEIEVVFEEFNDFIIKDFTYLANNIAVQHQVELYDKLLKLKNELYEDIKFIELLGKTLVGIGGSFSAGKSSFLNAIFNSEDNILPVETRPTTSIPTFVIQSDEEKIFTFNKDGSKSKETTYTGHKYAVCTYTVGEIVKADMWNDDRWNECTHGIHFFIDRQSAVEY